MATGKTSNINQTMRRKLEANNSYVGNPLSMKSANFDTPNITIEWNQPIILRGIPDYVTNTNKHPVSVSLDATKRTMILVYDTPGSVTSFTIPAEDKAVSAFSGPKAPAGTFPAA